MNHSTDIRRLNTQQRRAFMESADRDFVKRSILGMIIYAICWPMLTWITGYYKDHWDFTLYYCLSMWGVVAMRLLHAYYGWYIYDRSYAIWNGTLWGLCMAHAALWALIYSLTIANASFNTLILPLMFIMAGITSAATVSLNPKYLLTQVYLLVLFVPTLAACIITPAFSQIWPFILIFWLYQVGAAKRYWKEYKRAFVTQAQLQENQDKLELANKTDGLTGLYNRSYFDECLEKQWQFAKTQGTPLAILVIDIDYFKNVNDRYGHISGDYCLIHVAHVLKATSIRATDLVARYGGEEFVVILPLTDRQGAYAFAERLRAAVEQSPCDDNNTHVPLTVSIGVHALVPNANNNVDDLLREADNALYAAKNNGRNRVELAAIMRAAV